MLQDWKTTKYQELVCEHLSKSLPHMRPQTDFPDVSTVGKRAVIGNVPAREGVRRMM